MTTRTERERIKAALAEMLTPSERSAAVVRCTWPVQGVQVKPHAHPSMVYVKRLPQTEWTVMSVTLALQETKRWRAQQRRSRKVKPHG